MDSLASLKRKWAYLPFSAFLALLRAWALIFYRGEQAELGLFFARWAVYTALFALLLFGADALATKRSVQERLFSGESAPDGKRVFILCFVSLALLWLPHLLLKYPGAICMDSWEMLNQFRLRSITDFHSVFFTLLLGGLTETFAKLGSAGTGLFILVFAQYLSYVLAFAYSLRLIRCRMGASRGVTALVLLSYIVNPYIIAYHGVVIKDSFYCAYALIFTLSLMELALDEEGFCRSWRALGLMGISICAMYLTRKNGLYVVTAVLLCGGTGVLCKKQRLKPLAVMAASLALAMVFNTALEKRFHVEKVNNPSALSLPIQQTARYVKYYGEEISQEEAELLREVLAYDWLAEAYDPRIADPVKGMYRGQGETTAEYIRLWLKQFARRPMCHLSATMEQNHYLFVPEYNDNCAFYRDTDVCIELGQEMRISDYIGLDKTYFPEPEKLSGAKQALVDFYALLHRLPITGWLGNVSLGFYVFASLLMLAAMNKMKWLLQFMPGIVAVLFVVVGPVIYGHPRYMFPVIYTLPALTVYVMRGFKDKLEKKL